MPTDWTPNNGTQLERAIRALFVTTGAVDPDDCFISNESTERGNLSTGITTIQAISSSTDESEPVGNEKWQVTIQNKFGAALEDGQTDTAINRLQLDMRVGRQQDKMTQAGDYSQTLDATASAITAAGRALATVTAEPDATNDADMAEFTCLFVRYTGATRGRPEDGSCAWVEVRNYEITACPIAIN